MTADELAQAVADLNLRETPATDLMAVGKAKATPTPSSPT